MNMLESCIWKDELTSLQSDVAECLKTKSVFLKWDEEPSSVTQVIIQVDENGFFLSYTSDLEKEITSIDLSQISDVRYCLPKEKIRDIVESYSSEPLQDRSFVIVYGSSLVDISYLKLASWSVDMATEWVRALEILIAKRKFRNPSLIILLAKQYTKACCMQNSFGRIPIKNICKCLNANRFEQRFSDGMQTLQLPHSKNDEIDPEEFTLNHFYKLYTFLCPRQDLDKIFTKMCGGRAPFLKISQFVNFLNEEQRDPRLNEILFPYFSEEKASRLICQYESSPELSQTNRMGYDGFSRFLMSEDNLILKRGFLDEEHDLSFPLSNYFIHSSHNTYLIGRQFRGKSSVEMYRQCLLAGCRCIELDCWDGLNDEPIITHGRALCTNILFKDVIVAIKEAAFVTSQLPVILSFENHCSLLQQRKIAEYCAEIFGDMLLQLPLDMWPLEENIPLPPPNRLFGKIIIKNKKLPPDVEKDLLLQELSDNIQEKYVFCQDGLDVCEEEQNKSLTPKGTLPAKRLSIITENALFSEGSFDLEKKESKNDSNLDICTTHDEGTVIERNRSEDIDGPMFSSSEAINGSFTTIDASQGLFWDLNLSMTEKQKYIVSNGIEKSVDEICGHKSDPQLNELGNYDCHDSSDDMRTENISAIPNTYCAPERPLNPSKSHENISSQNAFDGARKVKYPFGKQLSTRSLSERSLKATSLSKRGDSQEVRPVMYSIAHSLDDYNDSDDEVRRSDASRSSSTASYNTIGSGYSRIYKKSTRGTSVNSEDDDTLNQGSSVQKNIIDPFLSSLVNYIQPTVFQSFESSEEKNFSFKISSFNECSAIQLVKTGPVEFTKYNSRQFSRIYPKGTRVDSTNYNPQAFWNVGCQLVALNLQTCDVPYQLNHGKFEANRQLGFLLKPEIMRRSEKALDPFTESPIDGIIPATISVKVISGQFLTDKKCQTYVMVELFGLPADTKRKNKTKLASSYFMNTIFGDEVFSFNKVILPELALLRFGVYDEGDKVLGQRVLPLDGVQSGYRHIPLRTESGQHCPLSTLFVFISLKTYVPEKFADFADRLFDPMKYESQAEKRREQMEVFDIAEMEEDIDASRDNSQRQSLSTCILSPGESPVLLSQEGRLLLGTNESASNLPLLTENDELEQPVSFEDLKRDKQFVKLVKKHQKDVDMLEKKHEKERATLQKINLSRVEKIKSSFEKSKCAEERLFEKILKRPAALRQEEADDLTAKYIQRKQYLEQHMNEKLESNATQMKKDEGEMTANHIHERVGLRLYQIAEQLEHLKLLLSNSQLNEERLLKEKCERQMSDLKKRQAKRSIDEAKNLNADRTIKSKEEKERLQRERDKQNMNRFISEREELARRHEKEQESLDSKHKEESERMEKEHAQIMEMEKNIFRKVTIAKQEDSSKFSKVSQRL